MNKKPLIGIIMGDPAGIGPELIAKLVAEPATFELGRVLLIGDRRHWQAGIQAAGVKAPEPHSVAGPEQARAAKADFCLLDVPSVDPALLAPGRLDARAGKATYDTLLKAIELIGAGQLDGFLFGPLNKEAMHQGGNPWGSELELFKDRLRNHQAFEELNILDGFWAVRVTSHIALRDVPKNITGEGVLKAIRFINTAMTAYGKEKPRLAVAALNPHAGEHGLYGSDEEGQIIAPAIQQAQAEGIHAAGPFPCDTIFLKLTAGQYDGVVNMYHDQGQIATKLLGFHRGVTYHAGFPAPIATPAHGTAFDIAGRGVANVGATRQAWIIAATIAGHNLANRR